MSIPLLVSKTSELLRVNFRSEAEMKRWDFAEAILVDFELVFDASSKRTQARGGYSYEDTRWGTKYKVHWPFVAHYRTNFSQLPIFAPVEMEGIEQCNMMRVELPPLHQLPWPKPTRALAEIHQRAAAERLLWGKITGAIKTKMDAACYLRDQAPAKVLHNYLRPVWTELLTPLDLA